MWSPLLQIPRRSSAAPSRNSSHCSSTVQDSTLCRTTGESEGSVLGCRGQCSAERCPRVWNLESRTLSNRQGSKTNPQVPHQCLWHAETSEAASDHCGRQVGLHGPFLWIGNDIQICTRAAARLADFLVYDPAKSGHRQLRRAAERPTPRRRHGVRKAPRPPHQG